MSNTSSSCHPRLFVADLALGVSLCLQGLWVLQTVLPPRKSTPAAMAILLHFIFLLRLWCCLGRQIIVLHDRLFNPFPHLTHQPRHVCYFTLVVIVIVTSGRGSGVFFGGLLLLIFIIQIFVLLIWAILQPKKPPFVLQDATVSANIVFGNPTPGIVVGSNGIKYQLDRSCSVSL
ncbi:hypothetical protein CsSME_00030786 [Camellia sinensis var. sinensis]